MLNKKLQEREEELSIRQEGAGLEVEEQVE
jgi:hypothetical protein